MYPSLTRYRQQRAQKLLQHLLKQPRLQGADHTWRRQLLEDEALEILGMPQQEPQTYKLHHLNFSFLRNKGGKNLQVRKVFDMTQRE
jgi:hypothetical protein